MTEKRIEILTKRINQEQLKISIKLDPIDVDLIKGNPKLIENQYSIYGQHMPRWFMEFFDKSFYDFNVIDNIFLLDTLLNEISKGTSEFSIIEQENKKYMFTFS